MPGKRFHEQQAAAKAAALLASQQAAAVALGFDPKALAHLAEFKPDHFFKADAMLASVESGAVAAVRGSYLVALRLEGGPSPEAISAHLSARGIMATYGNFYAVEVEKALGLADDGGLLRVGFMHYTTPEEVDRLLAALADA